VGEAGRIAAELLAGEKLRHAAVLIYLRHAGPSTEADLRRAMTGGRYLAGRTAYVVLRELLDMGLIEVTRVKRFKIYRITELGRRVAEEVERLLQLPPP